MLEKNERNPVMPLVMAYSLITVVAAYKLLSETKINRVVDREEMRLMLMTGGPY